MDLKDLDNIKINFIIGPGRSGTSLLVLLLNHSPDCIAAPEVHHLLYFYKKYRNVQTVSQNLIDDYTKYLEFFRRKNNPLIGLPDNALLNALYAGQKINYSQLSKLIYLSLFGEKGVNGSVKIIIDKNPHYTFLLDKLFRIFPDARVLALIRDYRGYILSNIQSQKPSSIKRNVIYYANAWNLFANHIFKGEKNYPSKIMTIRYEDLVSEKTQTLTQIFDFFGLSYRENVFDLQADLKKKVNDFNLGKNKHERFMKRVNDLSSPIHPGRAYIWEQALSNRDIEKADFICRKTANRFHYYKRTSVHFFKKLVFSTLSIWPLFRLTLFRFVITHWYYCFFHMRKYVH